MGVAKQTQTVAAFIQSKGIEFKLRSGSIYL
jgi:hypothetical protein